jgi:hypothetical protein
MGLGSFFKGIVDPRAAGHSIIKSFEDGYRKAQQLYPGADEHILLTQACLARMVTHFKNPHSEETKQEAINLTVLYACVPPPNNVRALAIHFIRLERPDIIRDYQEFTEEYEALMRPVETASERNEVELLYRRYNPTLAQSQGG